MYGTGYTGPMQGYGDQAALPLTVITNVVAPPQPAADNPDDPNTAWITLTLPDPQAEVFLNGVKMAHQGNPRKYVTPKLDPALVYHYNVDVTWPGKTGQIKYTTKIRFTAGDEVSFTVPKDGKDPLPAAPPPNMAAK